MQKAHAHILFVLICIAFFVRSKADELISIERCSLNNKELKILLGYHGFDGKYEWIFPKSLHKALCLAVTRIQEKKSNNTIFTGVSVMTNSAGFFGDWHICKGFGAIKRIHENFFFIDLREDRTLGFPESLIPVFSGTDFQTTADGGLGHLLRNGELRFVDMQTLADTQDEGLLQRASIYRQTEIPWRGKTNPRYIFSGDAKALLVRKGFQPIWQAYRCDSNEVASIGELELDDKQVAIAVAASGEGVTVLCQDLYRKDGASLVAFKAKLKSRQFTGFPLAVNADMSLLVTCREAGGGFFGREAFKGETLHLLVHETGSDTPPREMTVDLSAAIGRMRTLLIGPPGN